MREYDLSYHFDENLHEVPEKPSDMELYVHEQKTALNTVQSPVERVQNQIRLGHTCQWLKDFHRSNSIFQELQKISSQPGLEPLVDFIWQHAGKNHFDQMQWPQALQCFEKALAIREFRQAPADQQESSRQAIQTTLRRMN